METLALANNQEDTLMVQTDWRQVVTNPIERKIFEALEDPAWDWRTISALSSVGGLDAESTRQILRKYPVLVRQSTVSGPKGEELYTLQHRYFDRQTIGEKFWTSITSTSSSK